MEENPTTLTDDEIRTGVAQEISPDEPSDADQDDVDSDSDDSDSDSDDADS